MRTATGICIPFVTSWTELAKFANRCHVIFIFRVLCCRYVNSVGQGGVWANVWNAK